MTEEPDERVNQYAELIRRLFEEAMKTGETLPGEINIFIAAANLPKENETETQQNWPGPDIREPVSERYEQNGTVTITADLPGTGPGDIRYAIYGGVLYVAARADRIIYRAAYPLEGGAPNTLTYTYKNGVIEFTYKKEERKHEEEPAGSPGLYEE